FRNHP
ncbi:hypothetical protein D046_3706B, partial [Vibrio parahaemolyticus V-223/04]